jgi:hypothetical protein
MLRVRPILFTSALDDYASLLTALGLSCTENFGDWRVFDSGRGKVGLQQDDVGGQDGGLQDGSVQLGFEIRDRDIFVRRTLADGTRAELVDSDHGPAAQVTAPDGFSFLADSVAQDSPPKGAHPGPPTVVQLWHTPDVDAARKVLADIGARPVPPTAGTTGGIRFQAKNGGLVEVHLGGVSGVGLCLEFQAEQAALRARLTAAGLTSELAAEPLADVLRVHTPGGAAMRVRATGFMG